MRIAILDVYDGHPNEGMRCIKMLTGDFLSKEGVEGHYDVFEVRKDNVAPSYKDYDVFISSGGPGSPIFSGLEWENKWQKLISDIWNHNQNAEDKKFIFFICHSFQMAIQHFGIGKVTKRRSPSFGVMPVHKTAEGFDEPYFRGLQDPFWAVDSRDYQVVLPNRVKLKELGAEIVALEKIRPQIKLERAVMAVRFSREVFGVQFHPEADAAGMSVHFVKPEKKAIVIKHHGEEKYHDILEHLADPDKIMLTESVIIPAFLEDAYAYYNICV